MNAGPLCILVAAAIGLTLIGSSATQTLATEPGAHDVRASGARCDGVADDTAAVQSAIRGAGGSYGVVLFPPGGACRITGTIVMPRAVTLSCLAVPSQNSNSRSACFIDHDFVGTLFQLDGSGPGNPGSGYGIRNLVLRQKRGNKTVTAGVGTAVRIVATSSNSRATWVRFENVQIEEELGADPWTIGIDVDGSTGDAGDSVRDVWISTGRIQVGATTGTPAAIRIMSAQNVYLTNMLLNGPGGGLVCSGSSGKPTNTVGLTYVSGAALLMDFCQNLSLVGGRWGAITNTANTSGTNLLVPSSLTLPFRNNAGSAMTLAVADPTNGNFSFLANGVQLLNDHGLQAVQRSGAVADMIRVTREDRVKIDGSGLGVVAGSSGVAVTGPAGYLRAGTGVAYGALPEADNGTLIYCTNCATSNPCRAGGTGAIAKRLNGRWVCN